MVTSVIAMTRSTFWTGYESASYVVPFWTGFETLDLAACPIFWGWSLNSVGIRAALWLWHSREAIGEGDDGKNWI